MSDLTLNLSRFLQHFDDFDTAARGGERDNLVSREDVEAVARGAQYTPEQREVARYLLQHPRAFALLDTGRDGGGLYAPDGRISREDAKALVKDAPLFADTATFVGNAAAIPHDAYPGFEDPVAAAAQTAHVARWSMGDRETSATAQFMHFVREHQNDAKWLQGYFRTLGAEQTAQYLSNVAEPGRYHQRGTQYANQEIAAARTALQTLYESGALNDADIARLVEHWAMEGGDLNTGIAQLFGGLQGARAQDMQNAFFRATAELALAGRDLSARKFAFSPAAIDRLSKGDRESLAGACAYVLGQTSWENQTRRLIDLRPTQQQTDHSNPTIDRFITLAMANPTRVYGFTAFTNEAQHARQMGSLPNGAEVDYDGVARLVEALSYDTTYRGGTDRFSRPVSYPYGSLQEVRDQVFYSASNGLDANRGQWQSNLRLKDGLARIFTADYDRMVEQAAVQNRTGLDNDHPFPKALENFAQNVLFTEPSGTLRDVTSKFLVGRLSSVVYDVNQLSDAEFAAKYAGAKKVTMTHTVGDVLGRINNGMEQAAQVASDKHAAQRKSLEFGIDLAWALGQDGLKLLPGGNVLAHVLPDQITGSDTYKEIKDEIGTLIEKRLNDKAVDLLLEKFPGLMVDPPLANLVQELSEVISVDNERDFVSALKSSFIFADVRPAAGN